MLCDQTLKRTVEERSYALDAARLLSYLTSSAPTLRKGGGGVLKNVEGTRATMPQSDVKRCTKCVLIFFSAVQ